MSWIADVITRTTIQSTWGNAVRDRIVQTFANAAEANAHLSLPDGALMTLPTVDRHVYRKQSGAWFPATPGPCAGAIATLFPAGGLTTSWWYGRVDVPAGFLSALVTYSAFVAPVDGVSISRAQIGLYVDGVKVAAPTFTIPASGTQIIITRLVSVAPTGTTVRFDVTNLTGATVPQNLYQDSQNHWCNAIAFGAPATASAPPG